MFLAWPPNSLGDPPFYQKMDEITSQPLALTLKTYKDIQRLYLDFLFPFWKTEIDLGHHDILIIALLRKKNPQPFYILFFLCF